MMLTADIGTVRKGDIVRFKAYALRVEEEPLRTPGWITLAGRISINGCPLVRKRFILGCDVRIERESRDDMACPVCGSLLSAVTFTCVRGQFCNTPRRAR